MSDQQLLINQQHINYFLQNDEMIMENENTKKTNYILISFLVVTSTVLILKFIEEQKNKKSIKRFNELNH